MNILSFMVLWRWIKSNWPRCFLWHNGGSPWAEDPADGAGNLLECELGPVHFLVSWMIGSYRSALMLRVLLRIWLLRLMSGLMGSLVEDTVSGACSSGSGFFTDRTALLWANRRWSHLDDDLGGDMPVRSCRGFCSVPGPLQSVQRAEFWRSFLLFKLLMVFILVLIT